MKAFIPRRSPYTNSILTCYRELVISLWDVFRITGLPIVREIYDDFFPTTNLIMDQRLPTFLQSCSRFGGLSIRKSRPKFTVLFKAFVPAPLVVQRKNLSSSVEVLEDWGYNANHIDEELIWLLSWPVGLGGGFLSTLQSPSNLKLFLWPRKCPKASKIAGYPISCMGLSISMGILGGIITSS